MTETESKWTERVREWRAGGLSAPEYAQGRGFEASTLRWWASRLDRGVMPAAAKAKPRVRIAPVRAAGGLDDRRRLTMPRRVGAGWRYVPVSTPALLRELVSALGSRAVIPQGVQVFVALEPGRHALLVRPALWARAGAGGLRRTRRRALRVLRSPARCAQDFVLRRQRDVSVLQKMLDRGTFRPALRPTRARHVEVDEATLDALLDGVQVSSAPARTRRPRLH